ncbi:MerR family transcriptional regulator [Planococcus kocurii]|uniref:MerR family transcriptional regulator n=1 Tax=Caryophanaceae TaxID=186818 RepID=UPI000C7DFE3C|nr:MULTISPECIES: MerR family transcriptional regulator [Planococcaceae]KAA0956155.1 MerR family transcriptional regulator [Planococcus sp. ANT_H30]PKH09199.1 Hg(II)-responsive transcriptional regulator [Planomicrobium sp. MB-3u-38]
MKIGEVAKAANVNIETIRYYEKYGLISESPRTDSGYRIFFAEVIEDIRFIKRAQGLGFSLEEIKKLLSVSREHEFHAEEMHHFMMNKAEEVEVKIQELKSMKNLLEDLAGKCPRSKVAKDECPIIQKLEGVN